MSADTEKRIQDAVNKLETAFPQMHGNISPYFFSQRLIPYSGIEPNRIRVEKLADLFFVGGKYYRDDVVKSGESNEEQETVSLGASTRFQLIDKVRPELRGFLSVYLAIDRDRGLASRLSLKRHGSDYTFEIDEDGVKRRDGLTGSVVEQFGYTVYSGDLVVGEVRVGTRREEHDLEFDGVLSYLAKNLRVKSVQERLAEYQSVAKKLADERNKKFNEELAKRIRKRAKK